MKKESEGNEASYIIWSTFVSVSIIMIESFSIGSFFFVKPRFLLVSLSEKQSNKIGEVISLNFIRSNLKKYNFH